MTTPFPDGLYDELLSRRTRDRLAATSGVADIARLTEDEIPDVLGHHVGRALSRQLRALSGADREAFLAAQLALLDPDDAVVALDALRSVSTGGATIPPRPSTPLRDGALFTNSKGEPNVGAELALEMESADRIDLLCAFVKFSGITVIGSELARLRRRGTPLRVLTTTYMGATDRRALDLLVQEYGAEVRISYENASTRLHAKAWLFHRASGFDTAYVGSSNLSRSALVDGLEWNVRLSSVAHRPQVAKFATVFDSYWNSDDFTPYDPDRDAERLDRALAEAGGTRSPGAPLALSGLEVHPLPHQTRMLEALAVEREVYDRHRNLLVAATGTGKTVVAALDYARLCARADNRPTLLFVAHRKEILTQALRMYREVLGDGSFGELLVDGAVPRTWGHVFASIHSLKTLPSELGTHRDVIVIDEFHHAHAPSYRRLLDSLSCDELLGLTATPERSDGIDVRSFFDGRTAYELRLWDALGDDLLCPFHYYGIADNTDLTAISWKAGSYDTRELSTLYTGNDARVHLVLKAVRSKVHNPRRMSALGFCVSVEHAHFMARSFSAAGVPSAVITGETSRDERSRLVTALRTDELACVFTVDVFNEGVDIPSVDVVLLLRPTASATVFVQQLGRGLRRAPGKALLTVLDFVGHHRADFNLAARYQALTGFTRTALKSDTERGFPSLPGASRIVLDEVTSDEVFASIDRAISNSRKAALVADVRSSGLEASLRSFLAQTGRPVDDVYRSDRSWTGLRLIAAGDPEPTGLERTLLRRLRRLRTVDDPERIRGYGAVAQALFQGTTVPDEDPWARMLLDFLFPDPTRKFASYAEPLDVLRAFPRVVDELDQLMDAVAGAVTHLPRPLTGPLAASPLRTHARYQREELLSAIGWTSPSRRAGSHREGVAWVAGTQTDLLLVNLHKDERRFTPSTMYRDLPLSETLFAWESQSTTTQESPTGQRYLQQRERGTNVLLAVRNAPTDDVGTVPFMLLGQVDVEAASGERPISIHWRLRRPMPTEILQQAGVV